MCTLLSREGRKAVVTAVSMFRTRRRYRGMIREGLRSQWLGGLRCVWPPYWVCSKCVSFMCACVCMCVRARLSAYTCLCACVVWLSVHNVDLYTHDEQICAGIVAEVGREYEIVDRAPLSLGIEVEGGMMKIVIQKDTPTPCHRFHAAYSIKRCMHRMYWCTLARVFPHIRTHPHTYAHIRTHTHTCSCFLTHTHKH